MRWTEIHIFEGSRESPTEYTGSEAKMYLHHRYRGLVNPKRSGTGGMVLLVDGRKLFLPEEIKDHLRGLFKRQENVWVTFDDDIEPPIEPPALVRKASGNVLALHEPTAALRSPRAATSREAPLLQIVNQHDVLDPRQGPWLRVEVCDARDVDKDLGAPYEGRPGTIVHVKVTFDKDNSPVLSDQGVEVVEGEPIAPAAPRAAGEDFVFEAQVPLSDRAGGPAAFRINLGPAGGDRCTVNIGAVKGVWTGTLHVRNLRRIGLQSFAPDVALRQPCPSLLTDGGAVAPACLDALNVLYRGAFIEFYDHLHFALVLDDYRTGLLTMAAAHTDDAEVDAWQGKDELEARFAAAMSIDALFVTDAEHGPFGPGKAFVPNLGTLRHLRGHVAKGKGHEALPPDVLAVEWCDMMFEKNADVTQIDVEFATADAQEVDNLVHVLPQSPATAEPGIVAIAWVLGYKEGSSKVRYANAVPPTNSFGFSKIKELLREVGLSNGTEDAPLGDFCVVDPADQPAVVELLGSKKWKVSLPAKARELMAKIAEEVVYRTFEPETWVVVVSVMIDGVDYGPAGMSMTQSNRLIMPYPIVAMPTYFGTGIVSGLVKTLAHEIAHALGHTYMKRTADDDGDQYGRTKAMRWLAGGGAKVDHEDFGKVVPDGVYYVGHGHKGNHCSSGIPSPVFGDYPKYTREAVKALVEEKKHCVMWGAGGDFHADGPPFCETCLFFLRAGDCSDLRKDW
jgi:hypothetical protein